MKRKSTSLLKTLFALLIFINGSASIALGCSDAGTALATADSICPNGISTLQLTGYIGAIQWQSFNGTAWINETGTGSTTDNYTVMPIGTTDYRAVVTATGCPSDTSNIVTITVGVSAPLTQGTTRCGYGPVTLNALGNGIFKWYNSATGGTPLYTGSSFTTNVASTTTYYCAAATSTGGNSTTPMPAQATTFGGNARGYFFTAPCDFTMTGLFVPGNNGTVQNIAVVRFDNNIPPPVYATTTNAFTTLYLTQNNTATGVIPVSIPVMAGDVIGVLATRGPGDINSYATSPTTTTINGYTVTIARLGMQYPLATTAPLDLWQEVGGNISRLEITYETGCESPRTPTVATVNAPPAITLAANPPALCQGQSTVLSASSNNSAYTYSWSPSTNLSATSGSSVTANPGSPITYTVVASDGTCGNIDSIFIDVGPASVAGTATISTDTMCLGSNATLFLTGYTGNIQWQHFDGTSWINETGSGNNSGNYMVSPPVSTQYRAVVTSGGCAAAITSTLNLTILAVTDPVTVNDTICGPGTVNLTASGVGTLDWFTAPSGGSSINTGSSYNPVISGNTTYYVEASAGGTYHVGITAPTAGFQSTASGAGWGLTFDVAQTVSLDKIYIVPAGTSGPLTINMRSSQGGTILNTVTVNIIANSGYQPISLGWTIQPGTGYTLEMDGSLPLNYTTFGAAFPYTFPGSSVSITGYLNPNPGTATYYFFFYNWEITEGCRSNRVPVSGIVNPGVALPVITPSGNLLTSSSASNNQWYLNGVLISGANGSTYNMSLTGAGTYTVVVTDPATGCSATSAAYFFTGMNDDLNAAGISVYPNPVGHSLTIDFKKPFQGKAVLNIFNTIGDKVKAYELTQGHNQLPAEMAPGTYTMQLQTGDGIWYQKLIKL